MTKCRFTVSGALSYNHENTTPTSDFQRKSWNENPNLHDNYAEPQHALQVPSSMKGFTILQGVVIDRYDDYKPYLTLN
jgi:hypothetical protein